MHPSRVCTGHDVDPSNLVRKNINELCHFRGIVAKDTKLLAEVQLHHILEHCVDVSEGDNRHHSPKLFFLVNAHR